MTDLVEALRDAAHQAAQAAPPPAFEGLKSGRGAGSAAAPGLPRPQGQL